MNINTQGTIIINAASYMPTLELCANGPSTEVKEDGNVAVTYTVRSGGADEIEVHFDLIEIGEADEGNAARFDMQMIIGNGDWASPRDMQRALSLALDDFYARGMDSRWGTLVGE